MNDPTINARLEALRAAGIDFEKVGPGRYKVGEAFFYWSSTERWWSFRDRVGGYGIKDLIKAVRSSLNELPKSRE